MSLQITFKRAPRKEFDDAHDWYERQRPGLGERFSERVHDILEGISKNPEMHQYVFEDARRAVV
jgi:hypothetical protein